MKLNPCVKLGLIVIGLCLLCQCNKVNQQPQNQRLNNTPFSLPASAYLAMSENQSDSEKQSLLILAAGRLIFDGQWKQGKQILAQVKPQSLPLQNEKLVLSAKAALIAKEPKTAIRNLSQVKQTEALSSFYQRQYHLLLAEAYESQKLAVESVNERVKLDQYLSSESEKIGNRRKLWLTLTKMPVEELTTQAIERGPNTPLGGWMQLASIARSAHEPDTLIDSVQQWKINHNQHPANSILPSSLSSIRPWLNDSPQKIALLLPLSGPLSAPGRAVLDGFLAEKKNQPGNSPSVLTYDTHQQNAAHLYQQAVNDGAQYVVGPLSKQEVALVAAVDHPVPVLLLNDAESHAKANTYQFGLSPANEARQLALKAAKDGKRHALIIAPKGQWGLEITSAFKQQWQRDGGIVVDRLEYSNASDLNREVRDLLHVNYSEERATALKKVIGRDITPVTRRREDFDMIFLLAYPSKARQIMPLLRYYYAGSEPVYSISTVYAGVKDTTRNRDLDGIIFCDMPWVFQSSDTQHKNWPEALNSYNRLFAIGKDSYALATQLNQLILFPAMGVSDSSGILYLTQAQQVARMVTWGQFVNGEVKSLDV